jgi:hypothetical protein
VSLSSLLIGSLGGALPPGDYGSFDGEEDLFLSGLLPYFFFSAAAASSFYF